jgi:hypothetical protein
VQYTLATGAFMKTRFCKKVLLQNLQGHREMSNSAFCNNCIISKTITSDSALVISLLFNEKSVG